MKPPLQILLQETNCLRDRRYDFSLTELCIVVSFDGKIYVCKICDKKLKIKQITRQSVMNKL